MAGGPRESEPLSAWKTRLQAELDELKDTKLEPKLAEETNATPAGRFTSSVEEDAEHLFRVQVAPLAELNQLTKDNYAALEDVRRLLEKPAGGILLHNDVLTDAEKLRELDRLVAMAKTLGEVAVSAAS